jgi:uncharacterized protein YdcH (DUF465 family)
MTAKNAILTLTSASGKNEEIDALRALAAAIPDNTYLHDLFTPALVDWVAGQLQNDFPPDIYDLFEHEKTTNNAEAQKARADLTTANAQIESLTRRAESLNETIQHQNARIESLTDQLQASQSRFEQMWDDQENLQRELSEAEQKIIILKAKLFDLEHPEYR